ncbi:hypothetical protein [Pseudarthrobacter polychromogenes]|uniref:ASCH domain-containing protein n=1 Tax=Pseudarthrobacter polychromogenes TaxID=1676 RepID=A0ABQ1Y3C6_9MICC|nr:hypothetical protein [Pseudarthrobacter polychromogenes]GGH10291.1 hypothetical protein GCM10011577_39030 [Pseudarthrobacter polychromogenes]
MSGTHKALTVKQPWAYAIIQLGKDVENRSQRTRYRGPVLIHAGKAWAKEAPEAIFKITGILPIASLDHGMVIGQAHIVGCHHADDCRTTLEAAQVGVIREEYCSAWAMSGFWHWELSNQQYFEDTFPAKGKLGLWSIDPDDLPPAALAGD